jgi:DNA-binding NtrC family response regulator
MSTYTDSTSNDTDTAHYSDNLRKILIVDDDSDLTSMFEMVLEMDRFEVDAYNDASLALDDFKPGS